MNWIGRRVMMMLSGEERLKGMMVELGFAKSLNPTHGSQ